MRMSLAALSAYPFPAAAFTLLNGRTVDPTTDSPNPGDCTPYQCGADPANQGARMWCTWNSQAGSRVCSDPVCQPYLDDIPTCSLPQVVGTVPSIPTLTPANIVQPLPDISETLMPLPYVPDCSLWAQLNRLIADNPLIAVIVLAGVAVAVWRRK
jgi:hypothetical protein